MSSEIAKLHATITADTSGLDKGLTGAKKGLTGFGATAGAAMGLATKAIDIAIGAVVGFGEASLGAAIKFDKSLKNIQAVSGQTSAEISALGGELMNIGAHSVAGVQSVTDAYYDIASGITNASARMATLKAAVALSEAGNASLAASTSALISVMNSYGFAAEKAGYASDVLTRTVGVGVGTMEEFASALGPIAGLAAKVGVSFDELGAASAFLTTKGASASQSATELSAAMTALLNPNAQMQAALRVSGYASGEAAIKQLGLVGAINLLYAASGGSTDKMAKMAGSVEALRAMAALAGPEFQKFAADFENGLNGATEAARNVQLQSFDAQWKLFTNSLGAAAQAVGMLVLPALNRLISGINKVLEVVGKLSPQISQAFSGITGIFQPLVDEVNRVAAPLFSALGNIKAAFDTFFSALVEEPARVIQGDSLIDKIKIPGKALAEKIGPAFEELKATIGAELGKIDLMGLATGLINAAASFGQNLARQILTGVIDLGSRLISSLQAQFAGVDLMAEAGKFLESAAKFGVDLLNKIISGLSGLADNIMTALDGINAVDVGQQAAKFLESAIKFVGDLVGKIINGILGLGEKTGNAIAGEADSVNLEEKAVGLLGKALAIGGKLIGKLIEGIAAMGAQFGHDIARNLQSIDMGAAARSLLDGALKIGGDIINSVVSGIAGLGDQLIAAIKGELGKVLAGVQDTANQIGTAIAGALMGKQITIGGGGAGGNAPTGGGGVQVGKQAGGGLKRLKTDTGAGAGAGGANDTAGQGAAADYIAGFETFMDANGYRFAAAITAALNGTAIDTSGIQAKLATMFSGVDITASLTNLGLVISAAIATTFGPDGAVMTALKPFEEAWALMFGAGGTLATAAVGMQGTVDQLTASIVNVSTSGIPAIAQLEATSSSAAPNIASAWQPVVGVFRQLLSVLEGIAGAATRATSAMGAVPGVGGGGGGGGRASGGPVRANTAYVVGEKGPEMFVPSTNGQIIPASGGGGAAVGGAISIATVNVYGVQSPAQMYDAIRKEAQRRNA